MNALELIKEMQDLKSEIFGIKQGIRFFSSSYTKRPRIIKILQEEENKIQKQINDIEELLSNTNIDTNKM